MKEGFFFHMDGMTTSETQKGGTGTGAGGGGEPNKDR